MNTQDLIKKETRLKANKLLPYFPQIFENSLFSHHSSTQDSNEQFTLHKPITPEHFDMTENIQGTSTPKFINHEAASQLQNILDSTTTLNVEFINTSAKMISWFCYQWMSPVAPDPWYTTPVRGPAISPASPAPSPWPPLPAPGPP
jgi:hypothetical protein